MNREFIENSSSRSDRNACLYALAKENSATTVCCATHYNEPLLKAAFEVSVTIGTIDVVIVTDLLSEHDRHRTDGCTQDSIKKCPKHAEKHSRTTRSSYRP
eukprot:Em0087g4a